MVQRIVISESQYNRLFLWEQNNKNNIIVLPEANAGQIQEFLKSKGAYKGKVDWDFGDKSAEAFGKYYRKFGPIRTLKELYTELKSMGYPVGNSFGFGPKMAKVISDLIKEKESKSGDKVLQTSEKCTRSCKEMTDEEYEETLSWIFSDEGQKVLNPKGDGSDIKKGYTIQPISKKLLDNKNNCMKCHSVYGALGLNDRINAPDGDLSYLPSFGEMLQNPELAKQHQALFNIFNEAWRVGSPNALDEWVYEYRHEIIDCIAIVAYFCGPIGVVISIALEAINGGMYAAEGDWTSAILSWAFMAIPAAGPLARRLTAPVVKNIVKYFQKIAKINNNMGLSEKVLKKKISDLNKTLSKTERDIVELMTDPKVVKEITEETSKKKARQKVLENIKKDPDLYKQYLKWERGFGKGSKFLLELMNPTMLEKFIYAGAILGGIYLDKSGKMENFGQYVMEKLVDLGWVDADAPPEEKQAIKDFVNDFAEKYKNKDFGDEITEEEREKMSLEFFEEFDTTTNLIKKVYEYDLPAKVELINSELEQKKIILNKLKNVPEVELRDFDNYKWAQLCKGKNKLSVSSNITPEIEEFLNDEMFNIRRIKNNNLGKDYEYASDEDGLWYFKKLNTTEWKLVTDCMALLKIETAMEKDLDSDIDTEGEIFDLYKDAVDIEYKDF